MADSSVDYAAVLEDLQEKRAALAKAIEGLDMAIEGVSVMVSPGTAVSASVANGRAGGQIRSDTFFKMKIVDAAKRYLALVGQPARSTQAITDALNRGGLPCKVESVATLLPKEARESGGILKLPSGEWGLPEWYEREEDASGAA